MYNKRMKPRDPIAKDVRTPKYRMRVVESKVQYIRKPKHEKDLYDNQQTGDTYDDCARNPNTTESCYDDDE